MDDEDLPLVQRLQSGDDSALEELIARHRAALFGFIYRYVRNETDAADLAQETFVRVYFHIGSFRPRAKFATWLYTIATNLCRDHARSRHAHEMSRTSSMTSEDGTSLDYSADVSTPDEMTAKTEQIAEVERAIDRLPHELKTALILTALEGFSHLEAAEKLGTTPKAVETRVYRARKQLEKMLCEKEA